LFFHDLLAASGWWQLLYLAQAGFTIWMLIDAGRRHTEVYWFWIVLVAQPVGPWIYFFLVKWHDFHLFSGWPALQQRVSLDELRYQADHVPTLANHLALAERLLERKAYAEALPHLEAARALEPEHCQVLYGLAVCAKEQGQPAQALPLLEQILARDRRWSDYAAWRMLITVRSQTGDPSGALSKARDLARLSPTLQHQCLLAERLLDEKMPEEAETVLVQALETHRFAPTPSRRRNRRWASQARSLLKRVAAR
jgi:hypothetical protein